MPHVHDGQLYLSARDDEGRSHIGRVELGVSMDGLLVHGDVEHVLAPGALGAFDDSGVTTSCVVSSGARTHLYYTGWSRGTTVPFYLFIGCAISTGGRTFERVSAAPVFERTAVDPYLSASPWVLLEDGRWRAWYVSGAGWRLVDERPQHRYHIKYAESEDGVQWRRDGLVCIDFRDDDEYAFSRPCVVKDDDRYRMWFSARGDAYRIGYAESPDGLVWERRDSEAGIASSGDWDSEMQAYPAVFDNDGRRYMLYNGNGYGRTGIGWAVETDA
jgi:predicted GH43/DUF377 family glycosyl hydrolase